MPRVNRVVLAENYQNPGQVYSDLKTEGAFEVLANAIDANSDTLDSYFAGRGYIINCGTFTSPTSGILLDGGFF